METSVGLPNLLHKIFIYCGIIAAVLTVGTDIVAGLMKPGYRFDTQSASILSAFGTTTRPYVLPFIVAANILMIAFAVGVWFSADHNWAMRVTACLIAGNAVFATIAFLFFPMHPDEAMNSTENKLNVIFMGISVLLFFWL